LKLAEKANKSDRAKEIGLLIAKKAANKKVTAVVFDKGSYKYHGRVKAIAEGAREGGLKF
jgi:large subunit ribosomal protein L18